MFPGLKKVGIVVILELLRY